LEAEVQQTAFLSNIEFNLQKVCSLQEVSLALLSLRCIVETKKQTLAFAFRTK